MESTSELTTEEIEKELKSSLDKEFKHELMNWKDFARCIKYQEDFLVLSMSDDRIDSRDYSLKVGMEKLLRKIIKSDPERKVWMSP